MSGSFSRRRFVKLMGAAAAAAASGRSASADDRPLNVLFLMTDQQHFRCLGAAGNPLIHTPNLDRLAREGVNFTRATCVTPFCSPTRASLVTGLYPHGHGLNRNVHGGEHWLTDDKFPVTENILHDAGWATAHYGKWHLGRKDDLRCYEETGYAGPGYNEFLNKNCPKEQFASDEGDARAWGRPVYMTPAVERGHRRYQEWPRRSQQDIAIVGRTAVPREYLPETHMTNLALDWIDEHKDRPWMLTCSWSPPHALWVCPEPYYSMYKRSLLPMPDNIDICPDMYKNQVGKKLGTFMGPEGIREYLGCYWGQVSYIDWLVGRFLDRLDARGIADNTLVIFTSDHGDMQGWHGAMGKSIGAFYDEILRVPLLMRLPGAIKPGTEVDSLVSSVDMMPTILDYVGQPCPDGIHGRSLRPHVEGRKRRDVAFCERASHSGSWFQRMIRTERWKYAYRSRGQCELFDLKADPRENVNRLEDPKYRDRVMELHSRLRRWMESTDDPAVKLLESPLEKKA